MGLSAMGINRQLAFCLESANQCIEPKIRCLAIPRAAIVKMASTLHEGDENDNRRTNEFEYLPSLQDMARGILPSLRYVLNEEEKGDLCRSRGDDVVTDSRVNTLNKQGCIDPYGSDFFCIICHAELCNVYYRCVGCEKLLDKDYNICFRCYKHKMFLDDMEMGLDKDGELSEEGTKTTIRYHTSMKKPPCGTQKSQKCKRTVCHQCDKCWECSCMCHRNFREHKRFYNKQDLKNVMENCVRCAKGEEVLYAKETLMRLQCAPMKIKEQIKVPSRYYPDTENVFDQRRSKKD